MTFQAAGSSRRSWIRCTASLCVAVVLLVPLTRLRQRLEAVSPVSRAPSFSKNIDLPPKRVSAVPLLTLTSVVALAVEDRVSTPRSLPLPDTGAVPSPDVSPARPLRAPPSSPIA
jgi:hypothetical protein